MDEKMMNMSIINDLSEYITLRMSSYLEQSHDKHWIERKSHPDYDLWFIQSGSVKVTLDKCEHTAVPGDVVFFYPDMPYIASTTEDVCFGSFTFISSSASENKSEFWASFHSRVSCRATSSGKKQRCSPKLIVG